MSGIAGAIGVPDAARLVRWMLLNMNHRGPNAAGIVTLEDHVERGLQSHTKHGVGDIDEAFRDVDFDKELPGKCAIGHIRYSDLPTDSSPKDLQPLLVPSLESGPLAVVCDGRPTNEPEWRMGLIENGSIFHGTSPAELFLHLERYSKQEFGRERLVEALTQAEGAYSVAILTMRGLYVAVDPWGFRPLQIVRYKEGLLFASETCALDPIVGECAEIVEVLPGELIHVQHDGGVSYQGRFARRTISRGCAFEKIYRLRPDSRIGEQKMDIATYRTRLGRQLALRHPVPDADMVLAVPDSANNQAAGYGRQMGIVPSAVIVRSHFVHSVIDPAQHVGDGSRPHMKFNVCRGEAKGKRVVVVDDSLARGKTARLITSLLRGAGVKEVHLRIASPMVLARCEWGFEGVPDDNLITRRMPPQQIAKALNVDSVEFLLHEDLLAAFDDPSGQQHCVSCFTGKPPFPREDLVRIRPRRSA